MEFPDLGKHCSEKTCKQLDFLPMKCDACSKIFCKDHILYQQHTCPESYKKDNQVPVCPLCNTPVTVKRGEAPDIKVGQHMDNDCKSSKKKIYTNRCSAKGCKQKELIPFNCEKCRQNFCIKHRLEQDHQCKGFEGTGQSISNAGAAALSRLQSNGPKAVPPKKSTTQHNPKQTPLSSMGRDLDRERREREERRRAAPHQAPVSATFGDFQAGMSEDEAMARALAMSLNDTPTPSQQPQPKASMSRQEQEDLALAQALAASEQEEAARRRRTQEQRQKSSCLVS